MKSKSYTIQQLESASGVSRRTIRFYITRELLATPEGSKRGSFYTDEHLRILLKIRELVSEGYPLAQIKALLNPKSNSQTAAKNDSNQEPASSSGSLHREVVERIYLAPGIELYTTPERLDTKTLSRIRVLVQKSLSTKKEPS